MVSSKSLPIVGEKMKFFNSTQKNMDIETVAKMIRNFIAQNPNQRYRLAVGTDSQVRGNYTCFATGIHIHRIGQGAWCCVAKKVENRRYTNLREKISRETVITYEIYPYCMICYSIPCVNLLRITRTLTVKWRRI